jgi:hypothetical protein
MVEAFEGTILLEIFYIFQKKIQRWMISLTNLCLTYIILELVSTSLDLLMVIGIWPCNQIWARVQIYFSKLW